MSKLLNDLESLEEEYITDEFDELESVHDLIHEFLDDLDNEKDENNGSTLDEKKVRGYLHRFGQKHRSRSILDEIEGLDEEGFQSVVQEMEKDKYISNHCKQLV